MASKRVGYAIGDTERELDGDRVAQLPHSFCPGTVELIVVGEGLQARRFPDGEVTDAAVWMP